MAWLNAWFMYRAADRYNELTDHHKKKLFSNLSGRVLEIGAGTGANLNYYPKSIDLVIVEPSPYMQQYLRKKAGNLGRSIDIHTGIAEDLSFSDESFDSVISTLVLCSVEDLEQSLSEIKRVLKPGGRFYFIEHVAAHENSQLRTLQNIIAPLWKRMADGCHPNRNTADFIRQSEFTDIKIQMTRLNLPVVSPHIIGSAAKPA